MNLPKFVSLSAKPVDVSKYTWAEFEGPKSVVYTGKNRYHDLTIRKGDVIGYRKVRTGSRYYIVKLDAQGIVYKIQDSEFNALNKRLRPYKGDVEQQSKQTRTYSRKRKNASERFKPKREPTRERDVVLRENYLWYKYTHSRAEPIFAKSGDISATLTKNMVYGLRIISPKRGGYVCLEDGLRIRITTEKYDKLASKGTVLTPQPKGTILPAKKVKLSISDTERALQKVFNSPGDNATEEDTYRAPKRSRGKTLTYRDSDGTITSDAQELKKILRSKDIQEDTLEDLVSDNDLNTDIEGSDDPVYELNGDDTDSGNVNYSDIVEENDVDSGDAGSEVGGLGDVNYDDNPSLYESDIVETTKESPVFDVGYVVHFKKDTNPNRKYVIIDKYPYPDNDNLTSYILYDITNKPKYTQAIRLKSNQPEHNLARYTTYSKFDESWNSKIPKLLQLPESEEPIYE